MNPGADLQQTLRQLSSADVSIRDDAIARLYELPAELVSQPDVLQAMQAAYSSERDSFLRAGLGRLITLRKGADPVQRAVEPPVTAKVEPRRASAKFADRDADGPRVFITYSFGNDFAPALREDLVKRCFHVTLVKDTDLVPHRSLREALDERISAHEIVIPILDTKANRSEWVAHEISVAQERGLAIIPIVLDPTDVPEPIRNIPYLGPEHTSLLADRILAAYAIFPLQQDKPTVLDDAPLVDFMRRTKPFTRCIVDPWQRVPRLSLALEDAVREATAQQPDIRNVVLAQLQRPMARMMRYRAILPHVLAKYRHALAAALNRYGDEMPHRSLTSWQHLCRLLFGVGLMEVAQVLDPLCFPGFWHGCAPDMQVDVRRWQESRQVQREEPAKAWALEKYSTDTQWVRVEFTSRSGNYFKGIIPGTDYIRTGLAGREAPRQFLEAYQWTDICLPQLVAQGVVLAERFSDLAYVDDLEMDLGDYTDSGLP